MPCPCRAHAMLWACRSSQGHGTAVERWPVGYLTAFGFFRLPYGVPRRLLSEAYQSSSQRSIPTNVKSGGSTLQKAVGLAVWIFSGTTRTLTKDTALSEQGRGAAWHAWINDTAWQGNGIGTARARHGHGMGTACYVCIGLKNFLFKTFDYGTYRKDAECLVEDQIESCIDKLHNLLINQMNTIYYETNICTLVLWM